ncbi:A-kinase-interacting protein 1 isoform X2 [Melopsittacus undulatus]|uniref:A-kinase-interacting protein 1 isoform X2 n=1 Tax=Melopsittacus undulatus TaxID=13146 RepID=UPI00146BC4D6|nr:A-kinase-interacting protein 1 isoform X2 [Melopsittacus undulatus]
MRVVTAPGWSGRARRGWLGTCWSGRGGGGGRRNGSHSRPRTRSVPRAAEREPQPASDPEEDSERLNAAFVSIVNLMNQASKECEYYSSMATCTCKEHEIKHICRYHARQAEKRELESCEEKGAEASVPPSQAQTCQQCAREGSEDIYIEVSPGFYSVTATSEDMVQQTHMVDVHAGQSIDLTFVL